MTTATTPTSAPTIAPRFQEIARHDLHPSPFNPKERWQQPDPELAASMKVQGVIEPLIVRPRQKGGGYEIVAGHRRWAASGLAGVHLLPCLVRELTDAQVADMQLVENDQREGFGPMARAQLYAQNLKTFGRTQKQLSEKLGRTEAHVSQVLALLELPKKAVALVEAGRLDFTGARELLRLKALPARLDVVVRQLEWGQVVGPKQVKEQVEHELRWERDEQARKDAAAKEAERARKAKEAEKAKQRTDKKAQAQAQADKEKRARQAAADNAERARQDAVDRAIAALVKERVPSFVARILAIRAQCKLPPAVALMIRSELEFLHDDLLDGFDDRVTAHAAAILDLVSRKLPGKLQAAAKDSAGALSRLAVLAWLKLETKGLDAELERDATKRVAAKAKELLAAGQTEAQVWQALNAGKPPARNGRRK